MKSWITALFILQLMLSGSMIMIEYSKGVLTYPGNYSGSVTNHTCTYSIDIPANKCLVVTATQTSEGFIVVKGNYGYSADSMGPFYTPLKIELHEMSETGTDKVYNSLDESSRMTIEVNGRGSFSISFSFTDEKPEEGGKSIKDVSCSLTIILCLSFFVFIIVITAILISAIAMGKAKNKKKMK